MIDAQQTPYFYEIDEQLRQAVRVRLGADAAGRRGVATVDADGEQCVAPIWLDDGGDGLAYAPVRYPRPAVEAHIRVQIDDLPSAECRTQIGGYRPWTIYIAQDKHLDWAWIYTVPQVAQRINAMTDYYRAHAAERPDLRWNFDCFLWIEEYMQARSTEEVADLLHRLRTGQFEVSGLYAVHLTAMMGAEEIIRSLSYARRLEREHGVPMTSVVSMEVPSITWGLATLLAGAGIRYLGKGIYDLRGSFTHRRAPIPLFWWEGPDGSRVLMKYDLYREAFSWGGYGEAYHLRTNDSSAALRFIERTIERYEAYEAYPYDALMLIGQGWDDFPRSTEVNDFVRWANTQGWAYPKLVDARYRDFFEYVEDSAARRGQTFPVLRGDWGSSWEEWGAHLAASNALYRNARAATLAAERLAVLGTLLHPGREAVAREALDTAHRNLLRYNEHCYGGRTPALAAESALRKIVYAKSAEMAADRVASEGLHLIGSAIATGSDELILVANTEGWERSDVVRLPLDRAADGATHLSGVLELEGSESGCPVPFQVTTGHEGPSLTFVAEELPPVGYATYRVRWHSHAARTRAAVEASPIGPVAVGDAYLANRWLRLEIDRDSGGLRHLHSVLLGHDLVDQGSPWRLGQYIHTSEGVQHVLDEVNISQGPNGPVSASLVVEGQTLRSRVRTTYTLYADLPWLEIAVELHKEPSEETQACHIAFPLAVAKRRYTYDGPAAILRPGCTEYGGDHLPGSGQSYYSVFSFVAVHNDVSTVLLSSPDAHLVQFGRDTTDGGPDEPDPGNATVLSLILENHTRDDHAIRQGDIAHFDFRYRLSAVPGPFDSMLAVRHGWAHNSPPLARMLPAGQAAGSLAAGRHSFLRVEPAQAILSALKLADDGVGWVMRLWEAGGHDVLAAIDAAPLGVRAARLVDLLERDGPEIVVSHGRFTVPLAARGFATVRLLR